MFGWIFRIVFIVFLIIAGFVIPMFSSPVEFCTEKACFCEGMNGDITCNDCNHYETVFNLIFFKVNKRCSGEEIITCTDGEQTGTRLNFNQVNCKHEFYLLGKDLFKPSTYESEGIFEKEINSSEQ